MLDERKNDFQPDLSNMSDFLGIVEGGYSFTVTESSLHLSSQPEIGQISLLLFEKRNF